MKPGTPIFINGIGTACSDVEPEPFYERNAAAQAACTVAFTHEDVLDVHVSVDGGRPVDIHTRRFHIVSPQIAVVLPKTSSSTSQQARTTTLVADAYAAAIHRLTPHADRRLDFVATQRRRRGPARIVKVVPGA